jgi:ABC-type Fe3+-citrate transport system substrate-binding protein
MKKRMMLTFMAVLVLMTSGCEPTSNEVSPPSSDAAQKVTAAEEPASSVVIDEDDFDDDLEGMPVEPIYPGEAEEAVPLEAE